MIAVNDILVFLYYISKIETDTGNIYRNRIERNTVMLPFLLLLTYSTEYIFIQCSNITIFLKKWNEFAGWKQAAVLFDPADQCFCAQKISSVRIDLGLIPDLKLFILDTTFKIIFNFVVFRDLVDIKIIIKCIMSGTKSLNQGLCLNRFTVYLLWILMVRGFVYTHQWEEPWDI